VGIFPQDVSLKREHTISSLRQEERKGRADSNLARPNCERGVRERRLPYYGRDRGRERVSIALVHKKKRMRGLRRGDQLARLVRK